MAFINLSIELPNDSVDQSNQRLALDATKPHDSLAKIKNILDGLLGGAVDGQVLVAVRSTDAAVAASGGGDSGTLNLK